MPLASIDDVKMHTHGVKQNRLGSIIIIIIKRFLIYRPDSSNECLQLDGECCAANWTMLHNRTMIFQESFWKKDAAQTFFHSEKIIIYLCRSKSICYDEEWLGTFSATWQHGKLFVQFCGGITLQCMRADKYTVCTLLFFLFAPIQSEKGKINVRL